MNGPIPCRRPKIATEPDGRLCIHKCLVPGCGWRYRSIKTALEVGMHKRQHRQAVPQTAILMRRGGGYQAECDCGWKAPEDCLTRTDNAAAASHHLSTRHGLVSCP